MPDRKTAHILAFALAVGFHAVAAAQVVGMPILERDAAEGWATHVSFGAASSDFHGGGTTIGVSGAYGIAGFGVSVAASRFAPSGGNAGVSVGALITKKLAGNGQWLVDARAGLGGGRLAGAGTWRLPLAIGVIWQSDQHGFHVFRPWIATRLDITHELARSSANPVLSGGLEFQCLGGFTANATVERNLTGAGHGFSVFAVGVGLAARTARHSKSNSIFRCVPPDDSMS